MKTVLLLIALSLTLAACGIKGDPQPPKSSEKSTNTEQAQ